MGVAYEQLGKHEEGLEYLLRALRMREAVYEGTDHEDVAVAHSNVGLSYQALGKLEQALRHSLRALTMREALFGKDHPSIARSLG